MEMLQIPELIEAVKSYKRKIGKPMNVTKGSFEVKYPICSKEFWQLQLVCFSISNKANKEDYYVQFFLN